MLNYIDKNLNKNKYGLLLFIISIILTKNIISNQIIIKTKKKIIDINQYIYYFPQKQIILCSDKLFKNTEINLIPNEIKIKENEFICMINLKNNNNYNNNNYININLHIILPISNNSNKDSLDIFLGDTLVFKNLHFKNNKESSNSYQNIYTKKMIVKINNNKDVFFLNEENFKNNYINNNNNNIYFDNFLNFQAAKDSLFKGNHLMLNIKLNLDKVNKVLSFMEKNAKVKLVSKINTNIKNNNETSNSKINIK